MAPLSTERALFIKRLGNRLIYLKLWLHSSIGWFSAVPLGNYSEHNSILQYPI